MFKLSGREKKNNNNGRYEFDVHRKAALANVRSKPHSCIPSDAITSIFKGFLARATRICSEKYLRAEIEYLTDIFCENGHDRKTLQKIINSFEKKTRGTNNSNNNNNTNKKQTIGYQKSDQKSKKKYKSLDLE